MPNSHTVSTFNVLCTICYGTEYIKDVKLIHSAKKGEFYDSKQFSLLE